MRTRDLNPWKLAKLGRWAAPIALSSLMFGCPNQELAPLTPCTVSGVSLEVPQTGVDKVDMLFMIDNSGSMSEEQAKLAKVLPNLVAALATGNRNGMPTAAGGKSEFPPVQSLHIGVVTSDMGINGASPSPSCGASSFESIDKDPLNSGRRVNKPVGDDGILQVLPDVAVSGIFATPPGGGTPEEQVAPDATCGNITFPNNARFVDFSASAPNPAQAAQDAAHKFSCIARRGRNGCGLEQQLDAMLKALTPPDSSIKFTAASPNGHGNALRMGTASGYNQNFLRPDSILAVVIVSDEEDCSSPDQSRALFEPMSTVPGGINVRCGLKENQGLLHNPQRYIDGLKALKPPAYQDRIIFAGAVGIPLAPNTGGKDVLSGQPELDALLARDDMQFQVRPNQAGTDTEPVPTCISDSGAGSAAPGRRYLEVAKAFGTNGVVTSICADSYQPLLDVLIQRIADQLTGACLPRKLNPNPETGLVDCLVVEVRAEGDNAPCDPAKGRIKPLPSRRVNGSDRTVCLIDQVDPMSPNQGWYYDDFSKEVLDQCKKDPQRIAFTGMGNLPPGAEARFECFQPVASSATDEDMGFDALNLGCAVNPMQPTAPAGDAKCASRGGMVPLICVSGTCQIACDRDSQCLPGWICAQDNSPTGGQRGYCVSPTCPSAL